MTPSVAHQEYLTTAKNQFQASIPNLVLWVIQAYAGILLRAGALCKERNPNFGTIAAIARPRTRSENLPRAAAQRWCPPLSPVPPFPFLRP